MKTKLILATLLAGPMLFAQNAPRPQPGAPPPPRDGQAPPPPAPGEDGGRQRTRQPMRVPPVIAAMDVNKDGELSADEIANAPKNLATLDKDGDGKIGKAELHPAPPQGERPRRERRGDRDDDAPPPPPPADGAAPDKPGAE